MPETKLKSQSVLLDNNSAFNAKDSSGAIKDILRLDGSNILQIGTGATGFGLPVAIGLLKSKYISFTRNMATDTSNYAVTGVGFKPSALICLAVGGTDVDNASFGFCDSATSELSIRWQAGTWSTASGFIASLRPGGGGNIYSIAVNSFDADGFTISVDRFNSPSGTGSFYFLCLK